jgi:hypothetical protein
MTKENDEMILRHTTHKDNLSKIVEEGCLNGKYFEREKDIQHVSFELNPQNNVLTDNFYRMKNKGNQQDYFFLEFDGQRLIDAGYAILDKIGEQKFSKVEITFILKDLTTEEYEGIGNYRFVHGEVPLEFLTEESKMRLNELLNQ